MASSLSHAFRTRDEEEGLLYLGLLMTQQLNGNRCDQLVDREAELALAKYNTEQPVQKTCPGELSFHCNAKTVSNRTQPAPDDPNH